MHLKHPVISLSPAFIIPTTAKVSQVSFLSITTSRPLRLSRESPFWRKQWLRITLPVPRSSLSGLRRRRFIYWGYGWNLCESCRKWSTIKSSWIFEQGSKSTFTFSTSFINFPRTRLDAAHDIWQNLTPENPIPPLTNHSLETKGQHALETRDNDLSIVHSLELMMGVELRWTHNLPEWSAVMDLEGKHWYQHCLDELEGLVVSRMFMLSGTMSDLDYRLQT